jgi:hypothetical protein
VRRLIGPSLDTAIAEVKRHDHDSSGLLKSLLPYRAQLSPFEKRLRQGVTFWSLASTLMLLRDNDELAQKILPPCPSIGDPVVDRLLRAEALNSSSIVFRSWVSLVFMRPDDILKALKSIPNPDAHLRAFLDLFLHRQVRHIRNALSHGTFNAEFQEVEYQDREEVGQISFPELDDLNSCVFAFWVSLWATSSAPESHA